jgi:hypothetical protein
LLIFDFRRFPKTFGAPVWYLRSRSGSVFIKHNFYALSFLLPLPTKARILCLDSL